MTLSNVSINFAGLTGPGNIDPMTTANYRAPAYAGNMVNPTIANEDLIYVNDVPITFTASGGNNLAAMVIEINAYTPITHMIAFTYAPNTTLGLKAAPLWSHIRPSLIGPAASKIWGTPTQTSPVVVLPDFNTSVRKCKGNVRWKMLIEQLSMTSTISVNNIKMVGNSITTDPTSISFDLSYDHGVSTITDSGKEVYGDEAIKFMVAAMLRLQSSPINCVVEYDALPIPTIAYQEVIAEPITPDLILSLGAVSVNPINY